MLRGGNELTWERLQETLAAPMRKGSTHDTYSLVNDGVPGAIRTRGLSLRRRTLYPAELRRQII